MDDKPSRLGPAGQRVAQNVQDLRERQGLKQADVVERLREQGAPMLKTTLSKIENGQRGITADELMALAYALRVSPLVLLLRGEGAAYQLAPEVETTVVTAYEWIIGELTPPLPAAGVSDFSREDRAEAILTFQQWLPFTRDVRERQLGIAREYLAFEREFARKEVERNWQQILAKLVDEKVEEVLQRRLDDRTAANEDTAQDGAAEEEGGMHE